MKQIWNRQCHKLYAQGNRQCHKLYAQGNRQCPKLYAQGNRLLKKFHMCTADVKVELFRTFCTLLYTSQIWWNYRLCSIRKLNVAYNDIMMLLLRLPRYHSTSQLFANISVPGFQAVLRNLVFKFITRLDKSDNVIIQGLVKNRREWSQVYLCHMEALV